MDPTTVSTDHSREYVPLLLYPRPQNAEDAVYEGGFADTGATVFSHLTGGVPTLAGDVVGELRPERGWRRYTATTAAPEPGGGRWPARVGSDEVAEAARWLREHYGGAPETTMVLGSGLTASIKAALGTDLEIVRTCRSRDVPGWSESTVDGHPGLLEVVRIQAGDPLLLLEGRLHGYEGFDLSELQLAVRAMAQWGVERMLLTCAAGGLSPACAPGDVQLVTKVIDFQYPRADGSPSPLEGTDADLAARVLGNPSLSSFVSPGVYVAVPGPQYETEAENRLLRSLGATCVGMSLAPELRAAHDEGLSVAALALITNAGIATHGDVLASAQGQASRFLAAVSAVLSTWAGT